ncbi:sugar transferase [Collinsella aerofaciens]|uniref:sugar transferase n=1 Tax=Collinsella aerofaciens TaxID=74426 RepID=UPI00232F2F5D|nr:sugar transferase [Collinsella aerofaciens]MDB1822769.1 sugar transferase [Collinsella aerofaciens]MDB1823302.1 sugar transferase [Collinsella aerofaciens]MDB1826607.1 sugar transferase [Collinsella aerofaciens]
MAYRFVKRLFDFVFSLCVSVVLFIPIVVVCAFICLESSGSPVYSQERVGKGGKTIKILKLRSMVADAGNVQKYLSPEQLHQWEVERKVDDDPRITKVGQFIRKCSIDEMPQFLNVLNGDLSVIGPRPITRDELEQHFSDEEKAELLSVQPGITGLWQATDRNAATFESGLRQKIELRYVRNRCFRMDWKCFTGTFGAMFGKNKMGK